MLFCVVSMLSKLPPAVCLRGGGGGNRLPVEFPQVQTSDIIMYQLADDKLVSRVVKC